MVPSNGWFLSSNITCVLLLLFSDYFNCLQVDLINWINVLWYIIFDSLMLRYLAWDNITFGLFEMYFLYNLDAISSREIEVNVQLGISSTIDFNS